MQQGKLISNEATLSAQLDLRSVAIKRVVQHKMEASFGIHFYDLPQDLQIPFLFGMYLTPFWVYIDSR